MNLNQYLKRINYHGIHEPNAYTLKALHLAHMQTVPFENLSIHWQEPILLNKDDLFNKIVTRNRGGFCYELNGLFAALLHALGFKVQKLSARVSNGDGTFSPEFDHMTLLVTLEERWLADVGFGDSFREPILLDSQEPQAQYGRNYRVQPKDERYLMSSQNADEDWEAQYHFDLRPFQFEDYVPRCHYHQTDPNSHFQRSRICSLATENGRLTLSNNRLIRTTLDGERTEEELTKQAYQQVLASEFGITQ